MAIHGGAVDHLLFCDSAENSLWVMSAPSGPTKRMSPVDFPAIVQRVMAASTDARKVPSGCLVMLVLPVPRGTPAAVNLSSTAVAAAAVSGRRPWMAKGF